MGHVSPEAAAGGTIALIRDGDIIEISIPERRIAIIADDVTLEERLRLERGKGDLAFSPAGRNRVIPPSLKVYAAHVSSADQGAVRVI